jgi:hypothetical protein
VAEAAPEPEPAPEEEPPPAQREWKVVSTPEEELDGAEPAAMAPKSQSEGDKPTFAGLPDLATPPERTESRAERKRRQKETPAAKRSRRRRSDPEPGEEYQETGWMQGLSNRLSAYTIEENENGTGEEQTTGTPDAETPA